MRKTAAVIALLLVAACNGKTTATAPVTHAPSKAPVVTHPPIPKPAYVVTTSATTQTFTTANGNIGCDVEPAYARCDYVHRDWPLPPEPSDCASGWGHGIEMQAGTTASFFCGSDSVLGSKKVLTAGHGIKVGFVECDAVSAAQVQCKGTADSHGFTISRASYRLA